MFVNNVIVAWTSEIPKTDVFSDFAVALIKVHAGRRRYDVPMFLLPDLLAMTGRSSSSLKPKLGHRLTHVQISQESTYFPDIFLLLKLRWLLRLHSACCELEYKICSLSNILWGIQHLVLHSEEALCQTLVEDIIDQLQRGLGTSWPAFVGYVATCNPKQSVCNSKTNSLHKQGRRIDKWLFQTNSALVYCTETAFLTGFMRKPRLADKPSSLREFCEALEALGIPELLLPPLEEAQHLEAWVSACEKPTAEDNQRVAHKDAERLARLDCVLLSAAAELQSPEVLQPTSVKEFADWASAIADAKARLENSSASATLSMMVPLLDPADKPIPLLKPEMLEMAIQCVGHRSCFLSGVRARFAVILREEYARGKNAQSLLQTLLLAENQDADGTSLLQTHMRSIASNEKNRLLGYGIQNNTRTQYLRGPDLAYFPCR